MKLRRLIGNKKKRDMLMNFKKGKFLNNFLVIFGLFHIDEGKDENEMEAPATATEA